MDIRPPLEGFSHQPVLLEAVLRLVGESAPGADGVRWVVDGTLGGAGHASAILDTYKDVRLIGLDRDPEAVAVATERLGRFGARAQVRHARFSEAREVIGAVGLEAVSVMLVDLGVSSHQLDTPERGFSFRAQGPLDMRMDPTEGPSVLELLDDTSEAELAEVIRTLGEERYAKRIARAIFSQRPTTTHQLAEVIRGVVPKGPPHKRHHKIDPATRTFQALRMRVNEELEELAHWLAPLPEPLVVGGVAMAISFHSLEDRAVKQRFADLSKWIAPADPMAPGGEPPVAERLTKKPLVADPQEVAHNPRARSAKLRALRRLR